MESIAAADAGKHRQMFSLNLIRAFFIIIVVFDHCMRTDLGDDAKDILYLVFNPDAAVFFMLSGALLLPVTGGYRKFIKRRALRVLLPYVIWVCIYAFTYYGIGLMNSTSLFNQLKWGWMSYNFGSGWFMPSLISLYLMMPLLSPWVRTASRRSFYYVMAVWLVAGLMPYCEMLGGVHEYNNLVSSFLTPVPYALIGYYLVRYRDAYPLLLWRGEGSGDDRHSVASRRRRLVAVYTVALAVGVVIPYLLRDSFRSFSFISVSSVYESLPCIVTAIVWFSLLVKVQSIGRVGDSVVGFLARYSYGIYLNHWLICRVLIPKYLPAVDSSTFQCFAATMAVSVLLAFAMRKIPFVGRYFG